MKLKPYVCSLLLALGFGSVAYADTAAPPPLPPEMQQQLLDAQKKVLAAETLLVEEKIRNQQKEYKLFEQKENEVLRYTSVGTFLGLMLGLFGGWGFIIWKARDWVHKQVNQEIEGNLKHLTRIVDNSRLENLIKEKTRLLVLHPAGLHSDLHSELRRTGFRIADAKPCPASPADIDWSEYDQLVFDNMDEDTLRTYIDGCQNRILFAYTTGRYENLPANKVAIANSKMTLYSRLMESLTWHYWQTGNVA